MDHFPSLASDKRHEQHRAAARSRLSLLAFICMCTLINATFLPGILDTSPWISQKVYGYSLNFAFRLGIPLLLPGIYQERRERGYSWLSFSPQLSAYIGFSATISCLFSIVSEQDINFRPATSLALGAILAEYVVWPLWVDSIAFSTWTVIKLIGITVSLVLHISLYAVSFFTGASLSSVPIDDNRDLPTSGDFLLIKGTLMGLMYMLMCSIWDLTTGRAFVEQTPQLIEWLLETRYISGIQVLKSNYNGFHESVKDTWRAEVNFGMPFSMSRPFEVSTKVVPSLTDWVRNALERYSGEDWI